MTAVKPIKNSWETGESVRAPLLSKVIADMDPDRRLFIIDLGGLRSGTLHRLAEFRCRLDVLDFDVQGPKPKDDADPLDELRTRLNQRLPDARGETADLLLCWNYLNYFSTTQIELLMASLLPRLSERAAIHALIESSAPDMPGTPAPMAIADHDHLLTWSDPSEDAASVRVPAPRHSSDGLTACMPGVVADQTMLLGTGQKEYLFRRR